MVGVSWKGWNTPRNGEHDKLFANILQLLAATDAAFHSGKQRLLGNKNNLIFIQFLAP